MIGKQAAIDLEQIESIAALPVADVTDYGFEWVRNEFRPMLIRLARSRLSRSQHEVLAVGYCVLADIWDIAGAKRAALRAYSRAIELDPQFQYAWREGGLMAMFAGKWRVAGRYLRKAQQLDPTDSYANEFLEDLAAGWLRDDNRTSIPYRVPELLVSGHWRRAYALAKPARQVEDRFWRMCALVAGDFPETHILQSLRRSLAAKAPIDISYQFWFFVRNSHYEQPQLGPYLRRVKRAWQKRLADFSAAYRSQIAPP